MASLAELIKLDERREAQTAYIAFTLWHVNAGLCGLGGVPCKIPQYGELFDESKPAAQDNRTGQEILDSVKELFRKNKERRMVNDENP